ncbi:MAG: ATP-dependent helicase [Planktomarina sp.]
MNDFDEFDAFEAAAQPKLSQMAMAARPTPYLDGLNDAQREAVKQLDGPVLMLAGAGTGKTKALMARLAHLVHQGRAKSDEILSVTFTNKAAKEMKSRLDATPYVIRTPIPWMGTFHSICAKLLRRHAELVGAGATQMPEQDHFDAVVDTYDQGPVPRPPEPAPRPTGPHLKSNFTILDSDDQLRLLKQLTQAANIDDKRWPVRMLASIIDDWKNRAWTPDQVPLEEAAAYNHRGVELYAQYQQRLLELNACDFGDLVLHMVTIFKNHPDVLSQYQRWFKYILVDEYQDTNVAQYLWLRLLAQGHQNICCVGDDDQSIYGWRGAEVGNILRFEKDFPGAKVVRLEQNYRSTPHILAAASGVIDANDNRLGKTLWTAAQGGEKVRLIGHWDGEEEARWIGDEIEAAQNGTRGVRPMGLDEIAILVRASHQMRAFEDRFMSIGLPYRVIGGPRFYERMEIRDAMAYFRLVVSAADDLAFERIINTPKRGLGDKAQQTIRAAARECNGSLLDGARRVVLEKGIKGKGLAELRKFIDGIDRWYMQMDTLPHYELAQIILDECGYTDHWQNDKSPDAPGRLENLKELVKALEEFENLQGFLEHVSLVMDNDKDADGAEVSIMTLHAAKGLEFPMVFLPGWEDGLFPFQRSMDENGLKGLEEERRLAYVGITRAEEVCTISFAANRRVFGQWQSALPSRFVDELPANHVDVLTPPGLYGGGYGAAGMTAKEPEVQSAIFDRAANADVYNSPGWRRLQARGAGQTAKASPVIIEAKATNSFTVGDRVFNQKFGYGEVMMIDGDKLEVEFDKAGTKKVVAQFVQSANDMGDIPF